jgi:hypothetical protein
VAILIADYLIDHRAVDWPTVLTSWSGLVPRKSSLWLVNRFADLFLILPDGTVHMLDVGAGTLRQVADSRDAFHAKLDENDNANQWFMIPLVDRMVAAGLVLRPGQCYGFKMPPALGGDYRVENSGPLPVQDYLGARGSLHEQLRNEPDGARIVLHVINKPREPDAESGRGP